MLALTGNYSIPVIPTPLVETTAEPGELREVQPGDIIITQFSSYLNFFWLQYKYSPIFVIPKDSTTVTSVSIYSLFLSIIMDIKIIGKETSLNDVIIAAKASGIPIVLFPEGTNTNGFGILQFSHFGDKTDFSGIHFHILSFSHHLSNNICPVYVYGGGFSHLFSTVGRVVSKMKVRVALPQDVPKHTDEIDAKFIERCREILSIISRVPMISVDKESKKLFLDNVKNRNKLHNE
ncbi:putative lysophosphatidic acid:oleoyl-CoA acyltransferase [Histomonas meleagridis]|uniref:putative lysophosphatidic acid:oleoyl-CoA acyltransferase n=1 Tax=Histomonas meleagridis TaxID=135588 RepID=UPI00355AB347|nr:putative lysophosphatidic acid:oleoyl-CoA acyltransferase [Histomonas meleagridis]KAH0805176.1 putative lysophosphatidic acid:oleoyl-CoA acyltransferase [Histomonas meleagridis]